MSSMILRSKLWSSMWRRITVSFPALRRMAPALMTAVLASATLIYTACYWQPDGKPGAGTGSLTLQVQMPATAQQSKGGITTLSTTGEFAILVFEESVFRGPDGYTVLGLIMDDDEENDSKQDLSEYGLIYHDQAFTIGNSGRVSFDNLPAERAYTVIAWAWADEFEALDIASATVQAGQSTPVSLVLEEENHPKLIGAMLDYGVPILRFGPATGDVRGPEGNLLFVVGGAAIEFLGNIGTSDEPVYKHHFYMYPDGTTPDTSTLYDSAKIAGNRLNLESGTFAELILVTAEPFMFEGIGNVENLSITHFGGELIPRINRATIVIAGERFMADGSGSSEVSLINDPTFEFVQLSFDIDGFSGFANWEQESTGNGDIGEPEPLINTYRAGGLVEAQLNEDPFASFFVGGFAVEDLSSLVSQEGERWYHLYIFEEYTAFDAISPYQVTEGPEGPEPIPGGGVSMERALLWSS